jgi:hypothetical protein
MASLVTSHASIGDSTLKNARDLTISSFGGPEDFTLNLIDHMRRNKPSFKQADPEQLTDSSLDGPEDFTADIVNYANRSGDNNSSQRSTQRVIAPLRRASAGSTKAAQRSPLHSPPHSPRQSLNHGNSGLASAESAKSYGERQSRRTSASQPKSSAPQGLSKARIANSQLKAPPDGLGPEDSGNISILIKDGNVYHKKVRAGARRKMQPTVSDDESELGNEEDMTKSPLPSPSIQHPPEPTMSLPLPLLEDELTKPLGESTPTQHTLNSTTYSKNFNLEEGFDFATSLAHRIQRTPASAKNLSANEYSVNLSANASQLLAGGLYRPETFPHNDSFVRDCSDPNVAFADRIRGVRPDSSHNKANTTKHLHEQSKMDETELLRRQLEEMKAALAQKDEAITALQTKLSAKEAECEELHRAFGDKSTALAAAETRETALTDVVRVTEQNAAADAQTAAERFVIVKDALIAAEDEAAMAAERAREALVAAAARTDAALAKVRRLEREVEDLSVSARDAEAAAKRVRKEQMDREAMWVGRSEVLLAECDRRGRALMVKIGELELPGVRDEKGRQAYRYQREKERGRLVDGVR